MKRSHSFEALKSEYAGLWEAAKMTPNQRDEAMRKAHSIIANRPRYDVVAKATGVPWAMIGIIHVMECTQFPKFTQHLHNGDSLKKPTWQVPAGRPAPSGGPFTWEESAIDALTMKGKEFDKITDWSIERVAHCLELYNGWGYRTYHPEVHTPYLWSKTSLYAGGKYVRDGVWSATAMSEQVGAMAILKALIEIEGPAVDLALSSEVKPWPKAPDLPPAPTKIAVASTSRSVWYGVLAIFSVIANAFSTVKDYLGDLIEALFQAVPQAVTDSGEMTTALQSLAGTLRQDLGWIIAVITIVCIIRFIYRHVDFKHGTLAQ